MNNNMTNMWLDLVNRRIISRAQYSQILQYMAQRPQNQGANNFPNNIFQNRSIKLEVENLVNTVGQQLFERDLIMHERDQARAENQNLKNQVNKNAVLVQDLLKQNDQLNADNNRLKGERKQANKDKQGLVDQNNQLIEENKRLKKNNANTQDIVNKCDVKIKRLEFLLNLLTEDEKEKLNRREKEQINKLNKK